MAQKSVTQGTVAQDHILPAYKMQEDPVCICFAANETYAYPLTIAIYSLLTNASEYRCYDILILTKDLRKDSRQNIKKLSDLRNRVTIRFLDMSKYEESMDLRPMQGYLTYETYYRLFLRFDLFRQYQKMLYLDCDTLILGDVSELYDTPTGEYVVGAVEAYIIRQLQYIKNPVFLDHTPYSVVNYCKKVIGLQQIQDYFNAGVLLFNLDKFREKVEIEEVLHKLTKGHYLHHDQDILNSILQGEYYHLDVAWNYQNGYEWVKCYGDEALKKMMQDSFCDIPKIIHYVGGNKPWQEGEVILKEVYMAYQDRFQG